MELSQVALGIPSAGKPLQPSFPVVNPTRPTGFIAPFPVDGSTSPAERTASPADMTRVPVATTPPPWVSTRPPTDEVQLRSGSTLWPAVPIRLPRVLPAEPMDLRVRRQARPRRAANTQPPWAVSPAPLDTSQRQWVKTRKPAVILQPRWVSAPLPVARNPRRWVGLRRRVEAIQRRWEGALWRPARDPWRPATAPKPPTKARSSGPIRRTRTSPPPARTSSSSALRAA